MFEKTRSILEASYINGRTVPDTEKRWGQTSMTPKDAIKKYGKKNVRVKKKGLRNGDDMVEVFFAPADQKK